ncbi:MAG: hypothetical protein EOP85_06265, partial [Verrucomicrobiaceae bacterium]
LEINNPTLNQTFSNMAVRLTGGNIAKGAGAAAHNGSFSLFNGGASISSLASTNTSVIHSGVNVGLRQPNTVITTALGSAPDGIDLRIDGSINNSPNNFANPNLVKEGLGTLLLNNEIPFPSVGDSTVYTGSTTINAGTLMVGNGGTTGIIGTGPIIDNATLIFNRTDDIALANVISGTGTLIQRGTGAISLTGGGSLSGNTVVEAGRVNVGTAPFTASTFKVNANGTLATSVTAANSTATVAGLNLSGGTASFRVNATLSDQVVVTSTGGLSVTAPSKISLVPTGRLQVNDVFPLIDYTGTIGGASGFAGLSLVAGGNPHLTFSLVNNTTDTRVDVKVVTADTLVWQGNVDDYWDRHSDEQPGTANWRTASNNQSSRFYDYDKVRFTDAGSANTDVFLFGEIMPSSVEFDSTLHYTFTGDGIKGTAVVTKANTGTVTFRNANTYTGSTTISAGSLEIADGGSLGATAITNNATLVHDHSATATLSNVISGTGQFIKRGSGFTTLEAASTFSGAVIVEDGTLVTGNGTPFGNTASGVTVLSGGVLDLAGKTLPAGETVTIAGTGNVEGEGFALRGGGVIQANVALSADATVGDPGLGTVNFGTSPVPVSITGAHTLTKAGTNKLWYRGPANGVGNSLAALVINGGTFGMEANNNALSGVPITVNANGILSSWADTTGTNATSQNNPITLHGGVLGADYLGVTWTGPVTLTADSILGVTGSALGFNISGVISQSGGTFGLTKNEVGVVTLMGVNTYSGNTTVNAGGVTLADDAG